VRLTVEGEVFLNRAKRVLEDLHSATLEIRERAELKYGRIVIAGHPDCGGPHPAAGCYRVYSPISRGARPDT
jgi:DNA-binding transcriptional LysR family regulator